MRSPTQTRFEDLPEILPVFPLSGALLLPWGRLPLNIFEPRYLNLILDALKSGRLFGMIQPDYERADKKYDPDAKVVKLEAEPHLYRVGCVGRISSFEETEDGRLLITLKGLCRFRAMDEVRGEKGYRKLQVSYDEFKDDMETPPKFDLDRETLIERLRPYLDAQGMKINVDAIKGLSESTLVTSLCMICPFDPREKQALLEAQSIEGRAETLMALLRMGVFESAKPDGPPQ